VTSEATPTGRAIEAVLFDFAGVITASPWASIGDIGDESGVDPQVVLELMLGPYEEDTDHPWHRLERGEIEMLTYAVDVRERAEAAGLALDFERLRSLMVDLSVHEPIVERIRVLRADGYRTGLITNNVREAGDQWRAKVPLDELFDVVVDSSAVGMRKPNPAIFLHTLDLLGGVAPSKAVFLDDHPGNVAGAQRAGLHAILVEEVDAALAELDTLLAT
jgi:epoxide hydrolase-like predicted phosphatase